MAPYWNARGEKISSMHAAIFSFLHHLTFASTLDFCEGIAINHWYHVKVTLDPNLPKGEIIRSEPEEGFANTPSGGKFPRKWAMGGWKVDPQHNTGITETLDEVEEKE